MTAESNPEIASLRNQIFTLLVALIVVSGTLTIYLYREASLIGKDLNASRQLIENVNQGQPAIVNFANQLGAYSMAHQEIRPLLAKYGITPAPTQPVPAAPKTQK